MFEMAIQVLMSEHGFFFSFGYRPFLHAIQPQIQMLSKIAEQNPPVSRLSASKRLSTSSNESTHETDPVNSLNQEPSESETEGQAISEKQEEEGYECTIS